MNSVLSRPQKGLDSQERITYSSTSYLIGGYYLIARQPNASSQNIEQSTRQRIYKFFCEVTMKEGRKVYTGIQPRCFNLCVVRCRYGPPTQWCRLGASKDKKKKKEGECDPSCPGTWMVAEKTSFSSACAGQPPRDMTKLRIFHCIQRLSRQNFIIITIRHETVLLFGSRLIIQSKQLWNRAVSFCQQQERQFFAHREIWNSKRDGGIVFWKLTHCIECLCACAPSPSTRCACIRKCSLQET